MKSRNIYWGENCQPTWLSPRDPGIFSMDRIGLLDLCILTNICVSWLIFVYLDKYLCILTNICVSWQIFVYLDTHLCIFTNICVSWQIFVYLDKSHKCLKYLRQDNPNTLTWLVWLIRNTVTRNNVRQNICPWNFFMLSR